MIRIRRGLDVPIAGAPEQLIHDGPRARTVGVLGPDFLGLKPGMSIQVGERVAKGQTLFTDRKAPGICYTAPLAGRIASINRGERRALQSVVIDAEGDEEILFDRVEPGDLDRLTREQVADNLQRSGLWVAFRTRPFSKVPLPGSAPAAIFVTAIDSHPLSANPAVVLRDAHADFENGIRLLGRLTDGRVWVITRPDAGIPSGTGHAASFAGPHPAGLPGTHIHHLDPASETRTIWHVGYQDVVAIGRLFTTGRLHSERVVALGGPGVEKPRLIRTLLGASTEEITAGELRAGEQRIISGSVLGGRHARGALAFLGRYHVQLSVVPEGREREFMGWLSPGVRRHSVLRIYLSALLGARALPMTTNTNGSPRAIVPVGAYEKVMPLDILATPLLKSLVVGDTLTASGLGALELDEEDLALCSYVCPGKYEYGPILRDNLSRLEAEA